MIKETLEKGDSSSRCIRLTFKLLDKNVQKLLRKLQITFLQHYGGFFPEIWSLFATLWQKQTFENKFLQNAQTKLFSSVQCSGISV